MKLSKYIVKSPQVGDEENLRSIIFSTRTSQAHIVSDGTLRALHNGNFELLSAEQLSLLTKAKILVDKDENELQSVVERNNLAIENNETLNYVIQPSAWCQLGCNQHYCGQVHAAKKITVEHQEKILQRIRLLLSGGGYKKLQVGWFGAEPLAGLSVIKDMTPKLIALAHELSVAYVVKGVPTNGLQLNAETALMLHTEYCFTHFEITLDGTAEYHDKRRHTKKGDPTFERIFENILAIAKDERLNKVQLTIRCNVDRQNADGVLPLIQLLAANNLQGRVNFYAAQIHSWGNNDAQLSGLGREEYCDMEIEWLSEMYELGFNLNLLPQQKPIVCMAVNKDGEMVDAFGNQYNCTEASYVPGYGNEYKFGLLDGEVVPEKKNLLGKFNDEVLAGKYDCSACPMLPVCGGACPKEWKEGRVPCPTNKSNLDKKLLLYYVQQLQSETV